MKDVNDEGETGKSNKKHKKKQGRLTPMCHTS